MGIWEHVSCFITFTGKSKCHGSSGACSKPTHDKKWWTISRGKDNVGGFTPPRGCGFKHHCLPCSLSVSVLLQVALPLFDTSWYSYNQCKMFNWWLPVCFFYLYYSALLYDIWYFDKSGWYLITFSTTIAWLFLSQGGDMSAAETVWIYPHWVRKSPV